MQKTWEIKQNQEEPWFFRCIYWYFTSLGQNPMFINS